MDKYQFPLHFEFKVLAFAPQFSVIDAQGQEIMYVHQKLFKLKEKITVFENKTKSNVLFTINADKWIDWSASYKFTDSEGNYLGRVGRKGMKSIWKAHYEVFDDNDKFDFKIQEENGFVKILDGLFGEIPVLSLFTGYIFNPSYAIINGSDEKIGVFTKEASFFGRKFKINNLTDANFEEQERILLSLIMMVFLERTRG